MKKKMMLIVTILTSIVFLNQKIKAAEIVQNVKQVNNGYLTATSNHSNVSWYAYTQVIDNTNMPNDKMKNFTYVFENPLNVSDFVEFQLLISSPGIADVTTTNIENFCIQWTKSGSSDKYVCSEYNQNTTYSKDNLIYSNLETFSINAYVDYEDGAWSTCSWGNGSSLICPGKNATTNKGIKKLNIYYSFNSSANSSLTKSFSLNLLRSYINYDLLNNSEVIASIENEVKKDHEYNNNASKDTTEQENEINNYEQQEESLRNSLNLDIEDSKITINPEANSFIWETINKLRGMSSKIVLLFTSVLSLGLMKMILGR